MKKAIKIIILILFIGAFIGTIYYLYQKSETDPVVYKTETPFISTIIDKTVATGSVIPRKEIEIKPQVSGIITEIYVEAGDKVKKGDKIARIKIIPNMVNLNSAETRVENAKINVQDIKIQYDRQKQLHEKGVISDRDFQQVKYSYERAKSEVKAAENNLQLIREGTTKDSGNHTNTIVVSTISGTVLDVPVEEGFSVTETNNFNAGTTIATVADMTDMIFKGKVDESEVGKIKEGMPLILTIGALENVTFDATLKYISPKGVKENGAIQFEIKADVILNDSVYIRAGYSANADIVLHRADSVLTIRESLLQFDNKKAFVEVEVDSMKYERRDIETGLSDGINVQVLKGVKEGEKIKVWNGALR
ncbi:MAG: efflux transporter periplasmic adaptor subunit [Bacteroidetes bacterium]|nr:MAG: efflux transporter periplasmic adaptor subunit [Bacteroidota bacterium]